MKNLFFLCSLFFFLSACNTEEKKLDMATEVDKTVESTSKADFAIVIHGGAGTILKKNMSDEMEVAYKVVLEKAIRTGYEILNNGGTSLDAVTKTINVMEGLSAF